MRPLAAAELLDAWEGGIPLSPSLRAVALIAAAQPDLSRDDVADLPVGVRDGRLLTLRQWAFGDRLTSRIECGACGQSLEATFRCSDVRLEGAPPAATHELSVDGHRVRFRLPTSRDLVALESLEHPEDALGELRRRCTLEVLHEASGEAAPAPSERAVQAMVARMAELDPQASVRLEVVCPQCRAASQPLFDIVSFFWEEIHAWACRLVRDVHCLASAYGWSEQSIVAMSPRRRQFYLNLIGPDGA